MTLQALIREAANAHTRLNTFYAIIEILEGAMPGGCSKAGRTTNSIIRQCKAAAQVQLNKYDAAVEAIEAAFLTSQDPAP